MQLYRRKLQSYIPTIKRILVGLVFLLILDFGINLIGLAIKYQISPFTIWQVIFNDNSQLKKDHSRTNLLLLGIGGVSHEGGDLTDTIILLSLDFTKKDAVLLSIPRDIWIPTLKDKINAAYHLGEEKATDAGFVLAKASVEEVVGIPIHYALLIDFSGFKRLVDIVGGIEVNVADSFTDSLYPIAGKENDLCNGDPEFACRFETVSFQKGKEHMDGERALKYVRSRHAEGGAGTDFSRGKRQQAVLLALKQKLLSIQTLGDRKKIFEFLQVAQQTITTDIDITPRIILGKTLVGSSFNIRSFSLTQEDEKKQEKGLLINPPLWQYDGKWVLIPKHDGFSQINKYVVCLLDNSSSCNELIN